MHTRQWPSARLRVQLIDPSKTDRGPSRRSTRRFTPQHTPQGRGYDTSLGYFEHKNDFWSMKSMQTTCSGTYDLWDTDRPAFKLAGSAYEEYVFRDEALRVLAAHPPSVPPWDTWVSLLIRCPATQLTHFPM